MPSTLNGQVRRDGNAHRGEVMTGLAATKKPAVSTRRVSRPRTTTSFASTSGAARHVKRKRSASAGGSGTGHGSTSDHGHTSSRGHGSTSGHGHTSSHGHGSAQSHGATEGRRYRSTSMRLSRSAGPVITSVILDTPPRSPTKPKQNLQAPLDGNHEDVASREAVSAPMSAQASSSSDANIGDLHSAAKGKARAFDTSEADKFASSQALPLHPLAPIERVASRDSGTNLLAFGSRSQDISPTPSLEPPPPVPPKSPRHSRIEVPTDYGSVSNRQDYYTASEASVPSRPSEASRESAIQSLKTRTGAWALKARTTPRSFRPSTADTSSTQTATAPGRENNSRLGVGSDTRDGAISPALKDGRSSETRGLLSSSFFNLVRGRKTSDAGLERAKSPAMNGAAHPQLLLGGEGIDGGVLRDNEDRPGSRLRLQARDAEAVDDSTDLLREMLGDLEKEALREERIQKTLALRSAHAPSAPSSRAASALGFVTAGSLGRSVKRSLGRPVSNRSRSGSIDDTKSVASASGKSDTGKTNKVKEKAPLMVDGQPFENPANSSSRLIPKAFGRLRKYSETDTNSRASNEAEEQPAKKPADDLASQPAPASEDVAPKEASLLPDAIANNVAKPDGVVRSRSDTATSVATSFAALEHSTRDRSDTVTTTATSSAPGHKATDALDAARAPERLSKMFGPENVVDASGTALAESEPPPVDEQGDARKEPPAGSYAIHPPSRFQLEEAAALNVLDENGNAVRFGGLFEEKRTIFCFLRHWLCPFCQMFAESLGKLDPLPLKQAQLGLVVIGQGHWHVTKSYKEVMGVPRWIPMYSDPTRKIYKALGMTLRTNDQGPACTKPDYQTRGNFKGTMVAIKRGVMDMPLRPPGDLKLLGGEFILGPGLDCSFTHRMVTVRGHLDLRRVLVQAGCDMSLKSARDVLEEGSLQSRAGSTASLGRTKSRAARKSAFLDRKGKSALFGSSWKGPLSASLSMDDAFAETHRTKRRSRPLSRGSFISSNKPGGRSLDHGHWSKSKDDFSEPPTPRRPRAVSTKSATTTIDSEYRPKFFKDTTTDTVVSSGRGSDQYERSVTGAFSPALTSVLFGERPGDLGRSSQNPSVSSVNLAHPVLDGTSASSRPSSSHSHAKGRASQLGAPFHPGTDYATQEKSGARPTSRGSAKSLSAKRTNFVPSSDLRDRPRSSASSRTVPSSLKMSTASYSSRPTTADSPSTSTASKPPLTSLSKSTSAQSVQSAADGSSGPEPGTSPPVSPIRRGPGSSGVPLSLFEKRIITSSTGSLKSPSHQTSFSNAGAARAPVSEPPVPPLPSHTQQQQSNGSPHTTLTQPAMGLLTPTFGAPELATPNQTTGHDSPLQQEMHEQPQSPRLDSPSRKAALDETSAPGVFNASPAKSAAQELRAEDSDDTSSDGSLGEVKQATRAKTVSRDSVTRASSLHRPSDPSHGARETSNEEEQEHLRDPPASAGGFGSSFLDDLDDFDGFGTRGGSRTVSVVRASPTPRDALFESETSDDEWGGAAPLGHNPKRNTFSSDVSDEDSALNGRWDRDSIDSSASLKSPILQKSSSANSDIMGPSSSNIPPSPDQLASKSTQPEQAPVSSSDREANGRSLTDDLSDSDTDSDDFTDSDSSDEDGVGGRYRGFGTEAPLQARSWADMQRGRDAPLQPPGRGGSFRVPPHRLYKSSSFGNLNNRRLSAFLEEEEEEWEEEEHQAQTEDEDDTSTGGQSNGGPLTDTDEERAPIPGAKVREVSPDLDDQDSDDSSSEDAYLTGNDSAGPSRSNSAALDLSGLHGLERKSGSFEAQPLGDAESTSGLDDSHSSGATVGPSPNGQTTPNVQAASGPLEDGDEFEDVSDDDSESDAATPLARTVPLAAE